MNAFSAVFSFVTLVHKEELSKSLEFVYLHPHMLLHLLLFILSATVGQLFIFYTVKSFGAVVFSIIMSVRLLFSTLLSCAVYSHPIRELGVVGMLLVFGAVSFRIKKQTEGRPLIRWRDKDNGDHSSGGGGSIVREWHEHIDC